MLLCSEQGSFGMSQASLRCHICSWKCAEMVFLRAGNFPGLSHPLNAEQNWSRKRWVTCAAQRGWGDEGAWCRFSDASVSLDAIYASVVSDVPMSSAAASAPSRGDLTLGWFSWI